MISASHNPFGDNGIKLFAPRRAQDHRAARARGRARARALAGTQPEPGPDGRRRRRVERAPRRARRLRGAPRRRRSQGRRLDGMHVVLDCGNGAAFRAAPTGAARARRRRSTCSTRRPTASTSTTAAARRTPRSSRRPCSSPRADAGLAFDGDADRVIAVDERGQLVDGDQMLAIAAHRPPRPQACCAATPSSPR